MIKVFHRAGVARLAAIEAQLQGESGAGPEQASQAALPDVPHRELAVRVVAHIG